MAITTCEANKMERKRQRESIEEYRQANEAQAKMMMETSADLMAIIQKRIIKAEAEGENILGSDQRINAGRGQHLRFRSPVLGYGSGCWATYDCGRPRA